MNKLLVGINRLDLVEDDSLDKELIPYLTNLKEAQELFKRSPNLISASENDLNKAALSKGEKGRTLYILAAEGNSMMSYGPIPYLVAIDEIDEVERLLNKTVESYKAGVLDNQFESITGIGQIAASRGHLPLLKLILNFANANSIEYNIKAVLSAAVNGDHPQVVEYILTIEPTVPKTQANQPRAYARGWFASTSALIMTADNGSVAVARFLLNNYIFDRPAIGYDIAGEIMQLRHPEKILQLLLNDKRFVDSGIVDRPRVPRQFDNN